MLPRGAEYVPDLNPDQILKYEHLSSQKREINYKLKRLLKDAPLVPRPTWGPCTRCGATWRGKWPQRKPKCCAKCGNLYWDVPYSSYEAEQASKAAKEERSRLNDVRMLTRKAKEDEVAKALEVLHRHGLRLPAPVAPVTPIARGVPATPFTPMPPKNGTGMTPPPPPIFELPPLVKPDPMEALRDLGSMEPEVPVEEPSSVEEPDPDQLIQATCCSKPLVADGVCLNCGAGAERKVEINDGNDEG